MSSDRADDLLGRRACSSQEPGPLETLGRTYVTEVLELALATSKPVRTLMQAMVQVGCPVDRSFFHVQRCHDAYGGGFAPGHGVILCHNQLHSRQEVINAMAHELIHAYDDCRCRDGGARGAATDGSAGGRARPAWCLPVGQASSVSRSGGASATALEANGSCSSSDNNSKCSASNGGGDLGSSGTSSNGSEGHTSESYDSGNRKNSASAGGRSNDCSSSSSSNSSSNSGGGSSNSDDRGGATCSVSSAGDGGLGEGDPAAPSGHAHEHSLAGLDWRNCRHHACSEIRAANLSGDCSIWQEYVRGNLPAMPHLWADQQRACVARRAAISVAMNPACGGPEGAQAVVAEMLPAGLADTAPFAESEGVARP